MKPSAAALPKPMANEPEQFPGTVIPTPDTTPTQPAAKAKGYIAPVWHTLLIVALILGNSFLGSSKMDAVSGHSSRVLLYAGTFVTQLIFIVIIWFGIRSRGVRIRDLIGGRWKTVEAFLLDIALAVLFLVVSDLLLFGLRVAVGSIDLHNLQKSLDQTLKTLGPLAPHTYLEAGLFVLLSVFASLFEEIIFRGYLQRQFGAIANNAAIGIIVSGAIFGLGHAYQGPRMMFVLGVYGTFFGLLAHFRKSLRPGMMAHALQDSIAGIGLFRLVR